eukprot:6666736-Pyramimonas_sp.AAC.1
MHAVNFDISLAESMIAEMSASGTSFSKDGEGAPLETDVGTGSCLTVGTVTLCHEDHPSEGADAGDSVDLNELGDVYGMIRARATKKTREWRKTLRRSAAAFAAGDEAAARQVRPPPAHRTQQRRRESKKHKMMKTPLKLIRTSLPRASPDLAAAARELRDAAVAEAVEAAAEVKHFNKLYKEKGQVGPRIPTLTRCTNGRARWDAESLARGAVMLLGVFLLRLFHQPLMKSAELECLGELEWNAVCGGSVGVGPTRLVRSRGGGRDVGTGAR